MIIAVFACLLVHWKDFWLTCYCIMRPYTFLSAVLYRLHTIHLVSIHYDVFIDIILSILGTDSETNEHVFEAVNIIFPQHFALT